MSQTGMVVRWQKIGRLKPDEVQETKGSVLRYEPQWRFKQAINAFGTLLTTAVIIVLAVTKFLQGAWIVIILIPTLAGLFFPIHHPYPKGPAQPSAGPPAAPPPPAPPPPLPPLPHPPPP